MRAVIQRVKSASVSVDGAITGQVGTGFLIYLGVQAGDTEADLAYITKKVLGLRVFSDADDKMNLSIKDVGGGALVVSQFTLLGDARRGTRPSFSDAAAPSLADELYTAFIAQLKDAGITAECGVFGADMAVSSINDGPVTVLLDSRRLF